MVADSRRSTARLVVGAVLVLALTAGACGGEPPAPPPDAPRVNLVQLTSQAGTVTYGLTFTSVKRESFSDLTFEVALGDGVEGVEAGSPAGATVRTSKGGKIVWRLDDLDGPVILGPFVVRVEAARPLRPKSATVTWKGGRAETQDVKSRVAGVAVGVGTLRQAPSTSSILIGRETEVTGYAMGLSLVEPREVLITKDKLGDPPPPTGADSPVVVEAGSVVIKPEPKAPLVLEMSAPRPLPPFATVQVEVATGDSPFGPSGLSGRVGPLGDRVFVPFAASGKYRATVDLATYKAANSPMWPENLDARGVIASRAQEVSTGLKPAFYPALAAVDSDVAVMLLAVERARAGVTIPDAIPEGLSLNGLAVCSTIACDANNAPKGAISFCDLTADITACMPLDRPGAEVTVTVSGRDQVFGYCQSHVCFVPGRGIIENRPSEAAATAPIGIMAANLEMLWVANPTAG